MAFEKAEVRTPTSLGTLTITVSIDVPYIDDNGDTVMTQKASYEIEVKDQNGRRMRDPNDKGNLIPLLTDTEKTQIMAFMQAQKDKAIAGFLS